MICILTCVLTFVICVLACKSDMHAYMCDIRDACMHDLHVDMRACMHAYMCDSFIVWLSSQ